MLFNCTPRKVSSSFPSSSGERAGEGDSFLSWCIKKPARYGGGSRVFSSLPPLVLSIHERFLLFASPTYSDLFSPPPPPPIHSSIGAIVVVVCGSGDKNGNPRSAGRDRVWKRGNDDDDSLHFQFRRRRRRRRRKERDGQKFCAFLVAAPRQEGSRITNVLDGRTEKNTTMRVPAALVVHCSQMWNGIW